MDSAGGTLIYPSNFSGNQSEYPPALADYIKYLAKHGYNERKKMEQQPNNQSEIISTESAAHDYQTKMVKASAINGTHVLVGECGGLSAVFTAEPYEELGKYTIILTEHGYLYINNEKSLEVLEDSP